MYMCVDISLQCTEQRHSVKISVLKRELKEGEGVFVSPLLLDDLFSKQKDSVIYAEN